MANKDDIAIGSVALTSTWMATKCHTYDSFREAYWLGLGKIKGMVECDAISKELGQELERTLEKIYWKTKYKESTKCRAISEQNREIKLKVEMLDKRICDCEYSRRKVTYRQFLIESEKYFEKGMPDLDGLTDKELADLVDFYNNLWLK